MSSQEPPGAAAPVVEAARGGNEGRANIGRPPNTNDGTNGATNLQEPSSTASNGHSESHYEGVSSPNRMPPDSPSLSQPQPEQLKPPTRAETHRMLESLQIDDSAAYPRRHHKKNNTIDGLERNQSIVVERVGFLKRKWLAFWRQIVKPAFPEAIQDIRILLGLSALKERIRKDIMDPAIFPEVEKIAYVRRGIDLCPEEQLFLSKRKERVRLSFAKYAGLDPDQVHPDDVPIVAYGGSGGGFRAMIGCLAYGKAFEKAGLWDCLAYIAGVSGSCWSIAAYYTIGRGSMQTVIDHCKKRFSPYHPLSGDAIRTILSAPGGARATLGPLIQKHKSGLNTVAMDLYSVFTTGWIFFQDDPADHPGGKARREVAGYQRTWHKYSSVREFTDEGAQPMPIMTAIRHERPAKHWAGKDRPFAEPEHADGFAPDALDAWYQWYEMTPYEVGCDEISAWVPTWGFGRPFSEGKSTMQLPEQSLALLLGLATSAPAAPLANYLDTISRSLPVGIVSDSAHKLARFFTRCWGEEGTEEFQNHHPLHACHEHNFMFHYTPVAQGGERPPGLENAPRVQLIDSGLDNNCPTYVLLHPERKADVIINMDASSDVQKDSFQDRVDQIGSRRGLKFTRRHDIKPGTDAGDPDRFKGLYAQIYDGVPCERPRMVVDSYGHTVSNPPAPVFPQDCSMIYMPLLPNARAVPDFDPSTTKFSGSYNLVWTPDQVDMLVKVCEANFEDGKDVIRQVMLEAWQRKKAAREAREAETAGVGS